MSEWSLMVQDMIDDGSLGCIPDSVCLVLFDNASRYVMWEAPEYRKHIPGGIKT